MNTPVEPPQRTDLKIWKELLLKGNWVAGMYTKSTNEFTRQIEFIEVIYRKVRDKRLNQTIFGISVKYNFNDDCK